jgi:hypothetical protein
MLYDLAREALGREMSGERELHRPRWVAEHADLPYEVVSDVLALEMEFMTAVGVAKAPSGYEFRFYSLDDLAGQPMSVETLRLARDAERMLGIPEAVAYRVFEVEAKFMEMRGPA